ncbi:hypothetical protein FACS189429_0050 [Bacteroidia bacterium]|nr:hypothetical protein FACS189429_0050 [Bacteroidia bacterium]
MFINEEVTQGLTLGNLLVKPVPALAQTVGGVIAKANSGDNVDELRLALGARVEKAVHLTAADEYRKFFALTNIQTSLDAGTGFELELPGSHCDIGGGDADGEEESLEEDVMPPSKPEYIRKFIDAGWYADENLERTELFLPTGSPYAMPIKYYLYCQTKSKHRIQQDTAFYYVAFCKNVCFYSI